MEVSTRQLRYFMTVAEELHFRRAAERLSISQPALSQQIARLEAGLGVTLFVRDKRKVALTEAGEVLLTESRDLLVRLDRVVRSVREADQPQVLRVGLPEYANYCRVPEILEAFRAQFPETTLEVSELNRLKQLEALRAGRIDVGFMQRPVEAEALESRLAARIPLALRLPAAHPLAGLPQVPVSRLDGQPFLLIERDRSPVYHDFIMGCFETAGARPEVKPHATFYSASTEERLAASGVGFSVAVPGRPPSTREVVVRPLVEPTPLVELAAVWRDGAVPAHVQAFLDGIEAQTSSSRS